jgi:hypothetical protein
MAYEYPDRPTNRPDPIIEDGHKAPDQRKKSRAYVPIALAVAAILALAVVAAITTNESQEQVERGEVNKGGNTQR